MKPNRKTQLCLVIKRSGQTIDELACNTQGIMCQAHMQCDACPAYESPVLSWLTKKEYEEYLTLKISDDKTGIDLIKKIESDRNFKF